MMPLNYSGAEYSDGVLGRDTVEFEGRRGGRRKKSSTMSSKSSVGFSRINFKRRMPKADGSTEDSPRLMIDQLRTSGG